MPWQVNGLNVDLHNNSASLSMTKQPEPGQTNYANANVSFSVTDDDRQTEGTMEEKFRKRAKELLMEAANAL